MAFIYSVKAFKNSALFGCRNTNSRISYRNTCLVIRLIDNNINCSAFFVVLDSIIAKVIYHFIKDFSYAINLCDNAIKYNKENGSVDVIINQANNKTSITVKDTGIGIPALEQSRVFERFYRLDKSHSKLVGGTGLGLAIVKHGAAFHDAEVSLESIEKKGTSVTITFTE